MTTPDDAELDRRLAALARQADPDPRLWQAIEARLDAPARPNRARLAVAAAAVVFVVAVAGVVLRTGPAPDGPTLAELTDAEIRAMRRAAPEAGLVTTLDAPHGLEQAWRDNLRAIDELEAALKRDPGNRMLLDFLARARLRQAELLQQTRNPAGDRSLEL